MCHNSSPLEGLAQKFILNWKLERVENTPKIKIGWKEGSVETRRENAKTFNLYRVNRCICRVTGQALQRNSLSIFKSKGETVWQVRSARWQQRMLRSV